MLLGIPVINAYELTVRCLEFIDNSVTKNDDLTVVLIDNGSKPSYNFDRLPEFSFDLQLISLDHNAGYYKPMQILATTYPEQDYIGLIHNDVFIYEKGWTTRLKHYFETDPDLSLIGFCGSNEVDNLGGRGGGTVCNFDGSDGQLPEHTGRVSDEFEYACILDSLAMFMRASDIPLLEIDDNISPCHFYDRIWPLRLISKSKKVGYLGVLLDHLGGQTEAAEPLYAIMAEQWCEQQGIPYQKGAGNNAIYLDAEKRYLTEFLVEKKMIPGRVDEAGNFVGSIDFDINSFIGHETIG